MTWLETAYDLLTEPEPPGQDWLVRGLLADECRGVVQAKHKVGKTWVVEELGIAIVTGRAALGLFSVPEPGPVILILEESPRRRTRERLAALARGRGQAAEDLRDLHIASNRGISLAPGSEWRERILEQVQAIRPRAVMFDPLVRVKGAELSENDQQEMSLVLDFLSQVAREGKCSVVFSHHEPHDHVRLRGSSDLEAWWSSKILLSGAGDKRSLTAKHRDDVDTPAAAWKIESVGDAIRLTGEATVPVRRRILDYVRAHDGCGKEPLARGVGGRKQEVIAIRDQLVEEGVLIEDERGGYSVRNDGEISVALGEPKPFPEIGNAGNTRSLPVPFPPPLMGAGNGGVSEREYPFPAAGNGSAPDLGCGHTDDAAWRLDAEHPWTCAACHPPAVDEGGIERWAS